MKKRNLIFAIGAMLFTALFFTLGTAYGDVQEILLGATTAVGTLSLAVLPVWVVKDSGAFQEITPEMFEGLAPEEQLSYQKAFSEHRKKEVEKLSAELKALKLSGDGNAEKITQLQNQIKEADLAELASLRKTVETQGSVLAKLIGRGAEVPKTVTEQIRKEIAENIDKIKQVKEAGSGLIEFKAVGSMTTGSATLPVAAPELVGAQDSPAGNVNLRGTIVDSIVSRFDTSLAAYPYTETVPKDGDYAFVAEGASKPQIDFKIETRWAQPKKVAAHIILTDESVQDIAGLQSIATDYLRKKHDLKRQNGLLFGDGLGANVKGLTTYGRTFVAGDMALAVATPNIMDVINACITDVATTHNYVDEEHYMPNIAMLSYADFFTNFCAAKDGNGLPLYPTASLFGMVSIGGVTIMPFQDIPAGKILVADASVYNVSNYVPYAVKIGWINDQLITNQFTMVGESRLHAFVKNLDEQAIIYDDIATIKTAITKA